MPARPLTTDEECDRLMALLDVGIAAVRRGDGDAAIMATAEALKSAERLPKKRDVICLPDRSAEPA